MRKLQTFFYPPSYHVADADLQRRIRLAINISLAFLALLLVYQPIYLLELKNWLAVSAVMPAIILFLALLFLLRSGRLSFPLFANTLIAAGVVVHSINICTTGGPTSIFIAGYIDIQIMAALLVSRRATYIWTAVILGVPLALGLLELAGVRFPYTRLDAGSPLLLLMLSVGIIAGASLFAIMLKRGLDATLMQLRQRNEELAAAAEENIRMERRNAELEQQRTSDALRQSIAQDLHDDIGSTLSAINIYSNVAEQQGGPSGPLLRKISESSGKVMEAMNDIVWSISHSGDSLEAFTVRMREHAVAVFEAQPASLHIDFEEGLSEHLLPPPARKDFYLIYKEALNNSLKYAGAQNVSISLRKVAAGLTLRIRDDGAGFDTSAHTAGNGLRNMAARAKGLQGLLRIRSVVGEGTEVELTIPHR